MFPESKIYYFIADLHLGLQNKELEKEKEKVLAKFIYQIIPSAKALFILGDLFDYWFEYKKVVQKGFFRSLAALQDLSESGVKIHYIVGNHDFLHRGFFENDLNAILYESGLSIDLEGKKFYMGHGDGLVKNDIGYLVLKKILRNKFIQGMYSLIHPDLGIALASKTSKKSREYTKSKNYGEIDGVFEAAKNKINEGFDYVLFGHTHQRENIKYKNGYYINLGSWLQKPCYGVFENQKFEIIDL
ncbi:MAG: UDP-2,3-diacylglucosamine diphosphatase [Melioribacteraceae bacterium]|nr:UDP-2,3-diacylglucosamine diphosphatase [Melioribacteraceae bacterium]